MKHLVALGVCLLALVPAPLAAQTPAGAAKNLTVVSAAPTGEIASLAEANEIRIVFSEPMVSLGRIPAVVQAPYVRITPAMPGAFRWSGTTILIFTPAVKPPLPYATRYDVTVDATAAAVSGRTLGKPYTFSFTTPTVKLLRTETYRRGGRADAPFVVLMHFNQPVEPAGVAAHLSAKFEPHEWERPGISPDVRQRLAAVDQTALNKFNAKLAATDAVAASSLPVTLKLTTDWDKKRYPPSKVLVAFETVTRVPSESWVRLTLDNALKSPAGAATPASIQHYTMKAEPAFFVDGFECPSACDPDNRNPIHLRARVKVADFAKALRVTDVTAGAAKEAPKQAKPMTTTAYGRDDSNWLTVEDAAFQAQPPASTYFATVDASLTAIDGQTLGYTWAGRVENWHRTAFTSFGDGHGVWESSGRSVLPFYSRNLFGVKQWAAPLANDDLMPAIRKLTPAFNLAPSVDPVDRKLGVTNDRIQSHGLDVAKALGAKGTGLVWAAVENGASLPNSKRSVQPVRASLVQVTNLGVTVKDSPQNTLVFVTRLDSAAPVAGAKVSIINRDNSLHWSGTTGADGVATGPGVPHRERRYTGEEDYAEWQKPDFIVLAEKDGDIAYVGSNWNEGIEPWDFGVPFNRNEAEPMLRGTVFSDRGVYRLGEEVHFKAILRQNTPSGIRLLRTGTPVFISLRDSQNRVVDERTVTINDWSSAEWTTTLPGEGALGHYSVRAVLESDKPKARTPEGLQPGDEPSPELDDEVPYQKAVNGSFLVAAYRRPDFRVDVTLKSDRAMAGEPLKGVVTARYLFGAPMGARPVKWTFTRSPIGSAPAAVVDRFPEEQWEFVGWSERRANAMAGEVSRDEGTLAKTGELPLAFTPQADAGMPYMYTLEGDVEDVSRQHIANRASLLVHPASWYIGLRRSPYFLQQKQGLNTEVVTVAPDGQAVAGVAVTVTLTQIQWTSVRRAEGQRLLHVGYRAEGRSPRARGRSRPAPSPFRSSAPLPNGGYFILEATARDTNKRFTVTRTSFYALGDGYTAWARFDHNRIELVPERRTYKPGDTARIMIQSPWEQATALVTTEREGMRSHRQFALTSTQQSISIPITDDDIPNVFVSVLLVKGRSQAESKAAEPTATRQNERFGTEGPTSSRTRRIRASRRSGSDTSS